MPKIGRYDVPFFDLDSAVEKLRKIHDVLRKDDMDRDVVASTLDMSMTGGGFSYLVSSMEKFGLIKTGGGKLTITEAGKLILYGNESERKEALSQAVLNVELFNEIYSQYGRDATLEQIKGHLRQYGNVPLERAQNLAEKVDKIYKNVVNYIVDAERLERPVEAPAPQSQMEPQAEPPSLVGRRFDTQLEKKDLIKMQMGSTYFEFDKDDAAASEAALQILAKKLGLKIAIEKQPES